MRLGHPRLERSVPEAHAQQLTDQRTERDRLPCLLLDLRTTRLETRF
jgi:hypothetical protein